MVEISLTTNAGPLTMRSCTHCDTRRWFRASESDEDVLDLNEVLRSFR